MRNRRRFRGASPGSRDEHQLRRRAPTPAPQEALLVRLRVGIVGLDALATTKILSACDTHTCDQGEALASACSRMNR